MSRKKAVPMHPAPGHVYVVKAVLRNGYLSGRGYKQFNWPRKSAKSKLVTAEDWNPRPVCGGGLHAWIVNAAMDLASCPENLDVCDFLVVEVENVPHNFVDLGRKVKFREGVVVAWFGTWMEAHEFARPSVEVAGSRGTATAGDGGTVAIEYWDESKEKWRKRISEVGDEGLVPGKLYKLDEENRFAEVSPDE